MAYRVLLEAKAERDLKKIPKDIQKRIVTEIFKLKINPRLLKTRKISYSENYYRVRVGDYRVVYEINDKEKQVNIFRIRHRKEAYLNL